MRKDRSKLQNVPVDYDDQVERKLTNPKLLEFELSEPVPKATSSIRGRERPSLDSRSVLGGKHKLTGAAGRKQMAARMA